MKYIKNIRLLISAGLLLQGGICFSYDSDRENQGQQIQETLKRFNKIPVPELIKIVQKGDITELKSALSSLKANINEVDKWDMTAIMYAVKSGRKDIVKLLVDNGADPHIITWDDQTALREAVKEGHKDIIKLLLAVDSEFRKHSIDCALIEAAQKGHEDIVELLLDNGANPSSEACCNAPNCVPTDTTPLIEAAREGHQKIVKLLLDKGANHNIEDVYGNTALQIAKLKGHQEIVQLIDKAINQRKE